MISCLEDHLVEELTLSRSDKANDLVMPGLVPGIRAVTRRPAWRHSCNATAWMAGSSPAMTVRLFDAKQRYSSGPSLPPPEQPLDIGELQFDIGRPAVVALAGAGVASISRSSAFISSGLSARPARTEWWQAMVASRWSSRRSSASRAVLGAQVVGEVAHQAGEIGARRAAPASRAPAPRRGRTARRPGPAPPASPAPRSARAARGAGRDRRPAGAAGSAARRRVSSRWRFSFS